MVYLLHHSIDRAAQQRADHQAFACGSDSLTYGEVATQSNQLARVLTASGVRRGDRVAILAPRSVESAVAVYGILKAGAAFVPIDLLSPVASMAEVLRQSGARHLVTHNLAKSSVRALLSEHATQVAHVVGLVEDLSVSSVSWAEVQRESSVHSVPFRLTEQDLAYIMFTSGSTGQPKGIMHTHSSGLSYARLSSHTYGIGPEDRIGSHAALHFDMSTLGYLTGPYARATTLLIPEAYTKVPASLSSLMEKERLTIWYSVPFALMQLLDRGALENRDLSRLRWVLYGGEPFPPKQLNALMKLWPKAQFSNVYGPAEVNQCTYYHVSCDEGESPIPLGITWDNTDMCVVDTEGNSVSAGQTGELLISSPTMMRGYWNRPDLDRLAFDDRESECGFKVRYYRTGDLVRLTGDGLLHFVGRRDRQIKVRGFRVELDDVENALLTHADVTDAAVYAVRDGHGIAQLHAAVQCHQEQTTTNHEELSKHVAERLPRYACPTSIQILASIPRAPGGKTNYRALEESFLRDDSLHH